MTVPERTPSLPGYRWHPEAAVDSPADFRNRAQEWLALIPKMIAASRPILLSIAEAWIALVHELEAAEPEPRQRRGNAPTTFTEERISPQFIHLSQACLLT
jgi:hypothetical protein